MVLDECLAYPATRDDAAVSMERSVRWAQRCRRRLVELRDDHTKGVVVSNAGQVQFGIVQGGVYQDLRDHSAAATAAAGFEGYAIGEWPRAAAVDQRARWRSNRVGDGRTRPASGAGGHGGLIAAVTAALLKLPVVNWPAFGGMGNASWVQLSGESDGDADFDDIRWRLDVWNASAQVAGDVL